MNGLTDKADHNVYLKMPRKILYLVADSRFFLSHRFKIALAARAVGYEVTVACPADCYSHQITDAGLNFCPYPVRRGGLSLVSDFKSSVRLARLLQQLKPDLIHLIATKPVIYGGILARLYSIPSVAAISGLGYVFSRDTWKRKALRVLVLAGYRFALNHPMARVIVQNKNDFAVLDENGVIAADRTTMIGGSGVDLTEITAHALPGGKTVFALPARLLRDKGVYEFVDAARSLKSKGVEAIFRLLGSPDPQNPSSIDEHTLQSWNDEGAIEWHGYAADMNTALSHIHVCVLPSHMEGFPKTIIDASAAGRMSIVTDVPGCRDAIVPDVTGLLCKPHDSKDLASVMESVAYDRDLQTRMGQAARQHAEAHFGIEKVCQAHLDLYALQLGMASPRAP